MLTTLLSLIQHGDFVLLIFPLMVCLSVFCLSNASHRTGTSNKDVVHSGHILPFLEHRSEISVCTCRDSVQRDNEISSFKFIIKYLLFDSLMFTFTGVFSLVDVAPVPVVFVVFLGVPSSLWPPLKCSLGYFFFHFGSLLSVVHCV